VTVRVNLIPQEVEERNRAQRQRVITAASGATFLAVLAVAGVWKTGQVADAEDELAQEQATLAALQAEQSELQEFEVLETRLEDSTATLSTLLGGEMSMAGILQDVAAVMPDDAELANLNIAASDGDTAVAGPGETGISVGNVTLGGRTLNGHAPGLERFMLEFEKVSSFQQLFFTSSTLDEQGVADFTIDFQLGPGVLTGRYLQGLPEELR
jgi:Tfp pilus assembly protein PilN